MTIQQAEKVIERLSPIVQCGCGVSDYIAYTKALEVACEHYRRIVMGEEESGQMMMVMEGVR